MNFHLYNYLNYRNKQFAVVENPGFWNWTFTLKDENDNVLAQIDRDWRGVGFEVRFIYQICIFITTVTAVACFAILISKEYLDAWKICSIACQSFKNWCLLGSFVFVYLCILHYVFILLSGICFFNRNLGICWRTVSTFLKLVLCSRLSYIKRLETQAIVYSNMVIIMRTYVVVWKEILRFLGGIRVQHQGDHTLAQWFHKEKFTGSFQNHFRWSLTYFQYIHENKIFLFNKLTC